MRISMYDYYYVSNRNSTDSFVDAKERQKPKQANATQIPKGVYQTAQKNQLKLGSKESKRSFNQF